VPAGAQRLAHAGAAALYSQGGALYGCLGAQRTRLGVAPGTRRLGATHVARYALAPRFAGIATVTNGVDTLASTVSVFDLAAGAPVAMAPATTPERRAESFVSVVALVIDPHGTLAWIGERSAVGAFTPIYEVHALAGTIDQLLASSPKIAARSLALSGETLSWRESGRTRSAKLR